MTDMSGFDPGASAGALREHATRAAAVRGELAGILGEASSDDGLLVAKVGAGGLAELTIEPRAMRMPSVDLAAAIVELTRRAREDLDRRRQERAAELGVGQVGVDLDESMARLDRLRGLVAESQGDVRRVYERFRAETGG
jgi:hypothetical protein